VNETDLKSVWENYLEDRDMGRLVAAAPGVPDDPAGGSGLQMVLWLALGADDWELVRTLENRRVALPDDRENPGLLYAAIEQFGDVPNVVEWLINHGASIDARGPNDWTALHYACRQGHVAAASVLLSHGADVNAVTACDGGWTPLMEACAGGRKAAAWLLLMHGADSGLWNTYEGGTARDIAVRHGHPEVAAVLDAWPKRKQEKTSERKRRRGQERRMKRGRDQ
jgi:Ankyrin repeats (3 copies)